MLILHYTGMQNVGDVLDRLCDPEAEVSAHYVVEENGAIHQLVENEKRAWHAGLSYWQGETDINSASIGIEIVNPGFDFGYRDFPDVQIKAVIELCKNLMQEFDIPPSRVLGHSDIAITRKIDPGHLFPWRTLATEGVGIWPEPNDMDVQAAVDLVSDADAVHELLCRLGYDPSKEFGEVVRAFHRHYCPQKFTTEADRPDAPDIETFSKLLALLREMHLAEGAA